MSQNSRGVLVLFAHPALQKSRINRRLSSEPQQLGGVTFHDLYEAYPQFNIDVAREQELLQSHHAIVLQHPFYWYSTPAILKEWQDLVLEHGWAYGSEGKALRGKVLVNAVSTGGREEAYCAKGMNRFSMPQLLVPLAQTASLCGMRYLPPFAVHGTHSMQPEELEAHASDYRRFLEALRDEQVDFEAVRGLPRVNRNLSEILLPTTVEG